MEVLRKENDDLTETTIAFVPGEKRSSPREGWYLLTNDEC